MNCLTFVLALESASLRTQMKGRDINKSKKFWEKVCLKGCKYLWTLEKLQVVPACPVSFYFILITTASQPCSRTLSLDCMSEESILIQSIKLEAILPCIFWGWLSWCGRCRRQEWALPKLPTVLKRKQHILHTCHSHICIPGVSVGRWASTEDRLIVFRDVLGSLHSWCPELDLNFAYSECIKLLLWASNKLLKIASTSTI